MIEVVLKGTKLSMMLSAVLCIALGAVLILNPALSARLICYALGGILAVCALFHLVLHIRYKEERGTLNFNLIAAVITGVMGGWILIKPDMVIRIIPVIFGIVLIIHGVADIRQTMLLKARFYEYWWAVLLMALLHIGLAALLFMRPFIAVETLVRVIGLCLLYDGGTDIWIASRVAKAEKAINDSLETINQSEGDE